MGTSGLTGPSSTPPTPQGSNCFSARWVTFFLSENWAGPLCVLSDHSVKQLDHGIRQPSVHGRVSVWPFLELLLLLLTRTLGGAVIDTIHADEEASSTERWRHEPKATSC